MSPNNVKYTVVVLFGLFLIIFAFYTSLNNDIDNKMQNQKYSTEVLHITSRRLHTFNFFAPDLTDAKISTAEHMSQVDCSAIIKEPNFCVGNPFFCKRAEWYKKKGKPNDGFLCTLFTGSDKCAVHQYADWYDWLFSDLRQVPMSVLEIGIGWARPNFGFLGTKRDWVFGTSQRGWRDYFSNSQVYAADVHNEVLFEDERIKSFWVDILNKNTLKAMKNKIGTQLDILIDDSLHTLEGQESLISVAYDWVKPGGFYIVEDVKAKTICSDSLPSLLKRGINDFAFVQTEPEMTDSVLQIIRIPYTINEAS